MKKLIGLVGGLTYISTLDYYKYINKGINQKLGNSNSAECIIYSVNFEDLVKNGLLNSYNVILNACLHLKNGKATAIALCANTPHYYMEKLEKDIDLPFIHIATVTAKAIKLNNQKKVGLLGTSFTMELDFFKNELAKHAIEAIIPNTKEKRNYINTTIQNELSKGIIKNETKKRYIQIINELITEGAEGIILGCTEIPLLLNEGDIQCTIYDTAKIHSESIVNYLTT